MKILYPILLGAFFLFIISSCGDNPEAPPRFYYGNYNLEVITMEQSIDLNDDGASSTNFKDQVASLTGEFNDRMTFLQGDEDQMFFSIYLPNVLTEQGGVPIIRYPAENLTLEVALEEENNQFQLLSQQPPNPDNGEIVSIELLDQLRIEFKVNKSLYDFEANEWVDVQVNYLFVRGLIET
ncbi:hypothetical protein [Arthrospiribacter ruber]|uniref:Lipoprotein n=1 Tax=Arthrospiribacter ruber TaxID=2487934 RepID=A0A951M8S0_9BACT|nr:hypothetical protein [Arthrospiribacter ruber]MBW3467321.1 hypothetical protein [Arthrospiribacter ruber]